MKDKILILSIDGGGVRGIIPIQFLKYIESITSQSTVDIFSLIAGTSTGGLIACAISSPNLLSSTQKYNLERLEKFFEQDSKTVFPLQYKYQKNYFRFPLSRFWRPRFRNKGLQKVLIDIFCNVDKTNYDYRLADCLTPVLISSYNLYDNTPVLFSTRDALNNAENNFRLLNVCLSTSAAPTYLPAYKFKESINDTDFLCIDGGIFNNNPTMSALIEIYNNYDNPVYKYSKETLDPNDIYILSIGTGRYIEKIKERTALNGGKYHWATRAIDFSLLASSQLNHQNATQIFKSQVGLQAKNYLRLDISIPEKKYEDMTLSDDQSIKYLKDRFEIDFLTNTTLQGQLNDFLTNAGVTLTI